MTDNLSELPSTYYRVTARAIIFDERMRILVLENEEGEYELPGGGWEYDETFEECLRREVREELGVDVLFVGRVWFQYRGKRRNRPWFLRLCAPVQAKSFDFTLGPGLRTAYFVNREVFLNTTFAAADQPIKEHVDKLWPPLANTAEPPAKSHSRLARPAQRAKPVKHRTPVEKKRRKG